MKNGNGTAVDAVRRFNRFYTRWLGALDEGLPNSTYSLAEVRVLYELADRRRTTARDLARDLALDRGYLSRILHRFNREGLLRRTAAASDRRTTLLTLTSKGRRVFTPLNAGACEQVESWLQPLTATERKELLSAMSRIERLLSART
jgi:DNA-binding MarR family transcriptional regulator